MRKLLTLLLLGLTLVAGCDRSDRVITQEMYVFGTLTTVSFYGVPEEQATLAGGAVSQMFQQMHNDWHAWQKGALTEINKGIEEGRPVMVHPSLVPLIEKSQEACRRSDCLFNPAIGKLVRLWGFHSSQLPTGPIPADADIKALVEANPTMLDVEIKEGILTSRNRLVQMDFGGIAKGYAVELALKRLKELGVENAIVNAGGGLGVIGSKGGVPWRVGVRHPLAGGVVATLAVHDGENVHTSGNYERYREWQGKRYAHIIDPRTGYPAEEIVSVTVIDPDGAMADAFTKPLVIAGRKGWYEVAKRLGVKAAMLMDASGTVYMDPGMAQRIEFEGPPPQVVLSEPL